MTTDADTNGSFLTVTKHENYYILGGDLCILVEHTHFRVHRYFFERESKWFANKLIAPASPGSPPLGSSDANAIILHDVTPAQFAKFLWVFYNPRYSIYEADAEAWEIILKLSERWGFPEVKALSIRELERKELSDVKRIKLYHTNDVDRNILIPRYAALCAREEPLTLEEGMDLGMETTLQIAKGREEARSARLPSGARSPLTPTIRGEDLREVIRELFKIAPAAADTVEEAPTNPGALPQGQQPTVKAQAQQATPPPPPQPKKPTEKPKIQTQTKTPQKKKGPTTAPPSTTTTTTPAKETEPQSQLEVVVVAVGKETTRTTVKENKDENKEKESGSQKNGDHVLVPVPAGVDSAVDSSASAAQVDELAGITIVTPTPTTTTAAHLPDPYSNLSSYTFSFGQPGSTFGAGGFEVDQQTLF